MELRKKSIWLILLVSLIAVAWLMFSVENWRRDFSTNHAATDPTAADPDLRPLRSPLPPPALAEKIGAWAAARGNWRLEGERRDGDGTIRLHLVRSTWILRFKDDIHVSIHSVPGGGSVLDATSRSRVGKGDLGQNPRNLRELIRENRQ